MPRSSSRVPRTGRQIPSSSPPKQAPAPGDAEPDVAAPTRRRTHARSNRPRAGLRKQRTAPSRVLVHASLPARRRPRHPGGEFAARGAAGAAVDEPDGSTPDGVQRCNFGTRTVRLTSLRGDETSVWEATLTGRVAVSEHPGSPHLLDQSKLYAGLELKRFPLGADVEADAAATDPCWSQPPPHCAECFPAHWGDQAHDARARTRRRAQTQSLSR